jgi:hypothetical protein
MPPGENLGGAGWAPCRRGSQRDLPLGTNDNSRVRASSSTIDLLLIDPSSYFTRIEANEAANLHGDHPLHVSHAGGQPAGYILRVEDHVP